ncbi:hypothetical protein EDD22DRAFT_1011493 [Suillus occidentalis]|nr:hypothetical protein EDD22DRAFT_1011493 [Suillus occidentalis]
MHRALAITELLTHILRKVYNDEGFHLRQGIKGIARVSQVCKTFRDPALDFLWRHIDSLLPLLRLFPLEIHEEHGDNARLSKVASLAPLPTTFSLLIFPQVLVDLKSSERERYFSISSRVRTLCFSEPREPIPRNLIDDIVEYNLVLTPRLRKLEDLTIQAYEKPFEEIPRLSSFAPETFTSLKNVTFDGSPDIISRIFSACTVFAPMPILRWYS